MILRDTDIQQALFLLDLTHVVPIPYIRITRL